jgi:RNA polymerase sigma factor (sigma-70 family)
LTTDPSQDEPPGWADFLAYRERLLRIARSRTANHMDAEDVVQEALLRAAENQEKLDKDRMPGWLTAVTARLSVDSHRRRERETRHWGRAPRDPAPPGVEEEVSERDWAVWVARHLDRLPPRQRAALLLKAEGHDTGAVARELGVSYKSAESLLARARRTLRSLLLPATTGVAVVWQAVTRLTGRSTRATLLASASAGIITLSALVVIHDDVLPHRAPVAVAPVPTPSGPTPPSERQSRRPPVPDGQTPGTAPVVPAPPPDTPTPSPAPSLPVPLVPPLPSVPLPTLPIPPVPAPPGLPLPTLDGPLLPNFSALDGFRPLTRRTDLPTA